ncbi:MAG: glutathione S-transferase [Lautropia sp.]
MKLFHSATSPFVRKCLVVAHHLGLSDRIEALPSAAHPVNRDQGIVAKNPLGKVPTLITDDGEVLFDSRVICEYLNALGKGTLYPADGPGKWTQLTEHALADGILDAAILARYEATVRPENTRWPAWTDGQMDKIIVGLARFEQQADRLAGRFDLATIALGCALGYLDFRFDAFDWRSRNPKLAAWYAKFSEQPAMKATMPA